MTALELVKSVVKQGRISVGRNGRKIYCYATTFSISDDDKHEYVVVTNGNCKGDCFKVCKIEKRK